MSHSKFAAVFRYRFFDNLRGAATMIGILTLVMALLLVLSAVPGVFVSGAFTGLGVVSCIFAFVVGICFIREDLRLGVMCGADRKSIFWAGVVNILALSALLAVLGELLVALGQFANRRVPQMEVTDIYAMAFMDGDLRPMTFPEHIYNMVMVFSLLTAAQSAGAFLSLLFYRLPKPWRVIVAIALPASALYLLPWGLTHLAGTALGDFLMELAFGSVWGLSLCFVAAAVVLAAVNLLLLRRAPVRPVGK